MASSGKQVLVALEGTAAMGPFWNTILSEYLDKIIRNFPTNDVTGQKPSDLSTEFALVIFYAHGPYSGCIVQRSGWTKDVDVFFQWLHSVPFNGGGFGEAAITDGLSEALLMLSGFTSGNQSQQNLDIQKHCIVVAASNPHPLPTPVPRPPTQNIDKNDNKEVPAEMHLADAETLAKSFPQNHISLSILSPKQLPRLRAIYNAGKYNPRAPDASIDHAKNSSQFLILLSENCMEGRAALNNSGIVIMQPSQGVVKVDGSVPNTSSSVNGQLANRQPVSIGNLPATVKVEPTTLSSVATSAAFSHLPSISTTTSQGNVNLPNSTPSPASQEIAANLESVQEFKPIVNTISQTTRAAGSGAAKVNLLNNLSQARNAMNSASIGGANPIGLQPIGGAPMAMHMSNMISNGMASSALSGMPPVSGSGALMTTTQVGQNTSLSSLTSTTSNQPGNSNLGISSSLTNIQSSTGMGQSLPVMTQVSLNSGSQVGHSAIGTNQNVITSITTPSISSGTGAMISSTGMSQQVPTGFPSLASSNGSTMNLPSQQHPAGGQQPPKYVKIWEGALSGQRQGQPVFICRLEGYRNVTASEKLAEDWPDAMQIVRLISQDHMSNKQYVGKADFLVFRTLNPHGFLGQLQDKKLCAVIQLPSQTLLLSVSDKASRLIGMLFPGDMVVFKPQLSSQQQQQQPQVPQLQQQQQQQQQQFQQQQQQQQFQQQQQLQRSQMVGAGMSQAFGQGSVRPQMMPQGMLPQQGQGNMSGGGNSGFLP